MELDIMVAFPYGEQDFLISTMPGPDLWPTMPPIKQKSGALFPGVLNFLLEIVQSLLTSAKVQNIQMCTTAP
jgi:hypothetical protein